MPHFDAQFWKGLFDIIVIDILLSGDNAVVIALACRSLPLTQRRKGIVLGAGAAIVLRIMFACIIVWVLAVPALKLAGGAFLFWIAYKLMIPEKPHLDGQGAVVANLWQAVRTIAVADVIMSLDNVVAIGMAAKGHVLLIVLGLLVSIPLILYGSTLILKLVDRYSWLVTLGAGLLGYIAGETMMTDYLLQGESAKEFLDQIPYHQKIAAAIGALGVMLAGSWGSRRALARRKRELVDLAPHVQQTPRKETGGES